VSPIVAYTVREIASALRLSERTVHRLIKSGVLRAVRISRCVRVPAESLQQFVERAAQAESREAKNATGCRDGTVGVCNTKEHARG